MGVGNYLWLDSEGLPLSLRFEIAIKLVRTCFRGKYKLALLKMNPSDQYTL